MAHLRLFASARVAAGVAVDEIDGATVQAVVDKASAKYGEQFVAVLPYCSFMLDGESVTDLQVRVVTESEVAVLPPVSGGIG